MAFPLFGGVFMKIILITGFLGAGKTRFIKTLVEKTTKSIVILENEFGDLNLDGEYLKNNNNNQDDIKVWELTNGCICCSTNLDFTHSILTIANTINPEFLIIEPSGVAKIKNIIEKIKVISYERIELGLPILIIDSKNLDNIFNNYSEYLDDELKYTGLVAVSKSESMTDQQFLKIKSELNINNKSVFPLAHYSKWEDDIWEYIFNTSGTIEKIGNELSLRLKVNKNKIEKKLDQYTIENIQINSLDKLSYLLLYLMSKRLGNIERVKGYLTIKNNNYKFDLVGTNYEITGSEETFGNNVVIIGTDLKKDKLKTLFID